MAARNRSYSPKNKARILLIDDHPLMRQGLSQLIDQEDDLTVCGEAEDAHQALELASEVNADIAIVDLSLKGTSGIELIKNLKAMYPELLVLVLSMHDESVYAERALRAGAKGYIMKQEAPENVVTAVRRVLDGEIFLSENASAQLLNKLIQGGQEMSKSPVESLSDRELEVFRLIGQGFGTREIADQLHLSIKTIETYRAHLKGKLNLKKSTELVKYAVQWVESEAQS